MKKELQKRIAVFSSKRYVEGIFNEVLGKGKHDYYFHYLPNTQLNEKTVSLAEDHHAVCAFVNDVLNKPVLEGLHNFGINTIAMRCVGYNNIDLEVAKKLGFRIVRVPGYSPYAVAEHAACLMLALNRKIKKSINRILESNFELDGLLGFDLYGKTVGVLGTGRIGQCFINIAHGFGMKVICYDKFPNNEVKSSGKATYVDLDTLYKESDVISIHMPLTPETKHIINSDSIGKMKNHVMIVNTSRGPLIDTTSAIKGLLSGKIGYLGLDVIEHEEEVFFYDLSDSVIQDDSIARMLTFNNVIITGHQAFFTYEAISNIATTTINNLDQVFKNQPCNNLLKL